MVPRDRPKENNCGLKSLPGPRVRFQAAELQIHVIHRIRLGLILMFALRLVIVRDSFSSGPRVCNRVIELPIAARTTDGCCGSRSSTSVRAARFFALSGGNLLRAARFVTLSLNLLTSELA